jgi:plasmid stabilization system protein ParE
VAQVSYVDEALSDLERLFDFLAEQDPGAAAKAIDHVREAVGALERHPLIGRLVEAGLRELLISYGKSGYVALYDFLEAEDVVLVLALRHQREAGYPE